MAAIWTVDIQVTDLATKRVMVTGTRTDGAAVETHWIDTTVDVANVAGEGARVSERLYALHTAYAAKQAAEQVIRSWESGLVTLLNALEEE